MRKHMIALAAALALGTVSTAAMAQHHGGGGFGGGGGGGGGVHMGGGGGFSGGAAMAHGNAGFGGGGGATFARPSGPSNFAGTRTFSGTQGNFAARGNFAANGFVRDHDHDRFRHFRGGVGLFAFGGPAFYDYDYYADGCWQRRLVPTPFGWRWRLVDVCDY